MANLFDTDNSPETEPSEIVTGDLTQWRRTDLDDYDNSLYTLKYSARLATTAATEIEITASADGASDYLISEASATTAAYTVGTYYWQAYITRDSDSERILIDTGQWEVVANRDANTGDPRSHAKIMLDKIESLLEDRADADVESYSIGSRSITKMSPEELQNWRSHYRAEYQSELDAIARERGKPTGNVITARFVS